MALDPSSQKAAFLNIYSPHHLKDLSLKKGKKRNESFYSLYEPAATTVCSVAYSYSQD